MASGDTEDEDPVAQPYMDEEPQAAVIADVATAPDYVRDGVPDPTVLEEGVGRIDELYAVVPVVADGWHDLSCRWPKAASSLTMNSPGPPKTA